MFGTCTRIDVDAVNLPAIYGHAVRHDTPTSFTTAEGL